MFINSDNKIQLNCTQTLGGITYITYLKFHEYMKNFHKYYEIRSLDAQHARRFDSLVSRTKRPITPPPFVSPSKF